MKLLIAGSPSKFFHLKEFGEELTKLNTEYKLVIDTEIYSGFPSRKISNWFQTKKKFNKLIDEFEPDIIFLDRQTKFGVAAIDAKIPLCIHLRGDYWSEINWAKETLYKDPVKRFILNYKDKIAEKCFKDSTMILPICDYLKKIADKKYPNKSNVLYQGIDSSHWYHTKGMNLKHPCVGLLQDAKIWGKAKEMFTLQKVMKSMPDVTFYWVGDGPYRNKILQELNKYENFNWLGSLDYPDGVRKYLSEIDVYALVSGIDMSPLTLQEAQLMEKPVTATNVGGIPELMINNETGYLIEKGDYKQWIQVLTTILEDEKQKRKFGIAGKEFIKNNFGWNKIANDFLKYTKPLLK